MKREREEEMENRNLKMRGMALLLAAAVTGSGFWMMPAEKGVEAQAAAVQDLENEITQYEGYERSEERRGRERV